MDALLFAGMWQEKQSTISDEGRFPLVDEMQEIAQKIAPDWPQYSITRTAFMGPNSRFLTPYEHPVCCYGRSKKPVFVVGKEIDGYEGVFELSYCPGVKPIIVGRSAPIPKDPARKLAVLKGFEEEPAKPSTKSSSKKSSAASSSADSDK